MIRYFPFFAFGHLSMTDLIQVVEELKELMRPYRVCTCDDAVEGRFLENRFTHECKICGGVIPLKWAK